MSKLPPPIIIEEHPEGLPPCRVVFTFTDKPTPIQIAARDLFYGSIYRKALKKLEQASQPVFANESI